MNIPSDVIEQAHQQGEGNDADYRFMAEWARKEALQDAADAAMDHIYANRRSDYGDNETEQLAITTSRAIMLLAETDKQA